jgi:hypothetical protein
MPRQFADDDSDDHEESWDDSDQDYDSFDDDDDEPTVLCPYCRREIHEDSVRCPYCERYISREDVPAERKPWWILVGTGVGLYAVWRWLHG